MNTSVPAHTRRFQLKNKLLSGMVLRFSVTEAARSATAKAKRDAAKVAARV